MHSCCLIVALCCAQVSALDRGSDDDFPYKAYVRTDDVYVRSGPGSSYYPTDQLARGEQVEVYRHDTGGWCAIRPPKNSFSWIASRHVSLGNDGIAEVTDDGIVVRIGSNLSNLRDVTQVKLDRGEVVEVIDGPRSRDGEATDAWWKIEPPAGEFRWVSLAIPRDPPPRDPRAGGGKDTADSRRDDRAAPADVDRLANRRTGWTAPGQRGESVSVFSPEDFQREVSDIEMTLSTMVAKEPSLWQFDSLLARCDTAFDRAPSQEDRNRIRGVHNRIARFDELKRRQRDVAERKPDAGLRKDSGPGYGSLEAARAATTPTVGNSGPLLGLPAAGGTAATPSSTSMAFGSALGGNPPAGAAAANLSPAGALASTAPAAGNYDGVGRLTKVVSRKTGTPNYALVSPSGEIITFVSPAPGVNLSTYAGQEVGLSGQRGFSTELNKPHLTAQRITPLVR